MATKHQLQHYMFNNPNENLISQLGQVVTHLEVATFRLQYIQVSSFTQLYTYVQYLYTFKNCRIYIMTDPVWNLQQTST